jgi:glycine cleavage system aminomethyltransferase T
MAYFAFRPCTIGGTDAWIGRLGYTGELGYELLVPAEYAAEVWTRLAQAPLAALRLECGMEAANSLRIEAGHIHFAYELAQRAFPAELGLARLVRDGGGDFIGRDALRRIRRFDRRIAGVSLDRSSPVPGPRLRGSRPTVHLTSEAFSPVFERVLGLAYVCDADLAAVVYTDDGRKGELARLPFRDPMRRLSRQDVRRAGD